MEAIENDTQLSPARVSLYWLMKKDCLQELLSDFEAVEMRPENMKTMPKGKTDGYFEDIPLTFSPASKSRRKDVIPPYSPLESSIPLFLSTNNEEVQPTTKKKRKREEAEAPYEEYPAMPDDIECRATKCRHSF